MSDVPLGMSTLPAASNEPLKPFFASATSSAATVLPSEAPMTTPILVEVASVSSVPVRNSIVVVVAAHGQRQRVVVGNVGGAERQLRRLAHDVETADQEARGVEMLRTHRDRRRRHRCAAAVSEDSTLSLVAPAPIRLTPLNWAAAATALICEMKALMSF